MSRQSHKAQPAQAAARFGWLDTGLTSNPCWPFADGGDDRIISAASRKQSVQPFSCPAIAPIIGRSSGATQVQPNAITARPMAARAVQNVEPSNR
jgi:hypothetical protein